MIRSIALDDEPMALEVIKSHCQSVGEIELVKTFTQPSEAKKYIRKFPVDLIFLDIQMPDMNGLDFFKSLDRELMVIFTTAFSEYAVEGFNVSAVDYLLKPILPDRFRTACSKAVDYFQYSRASGSEVQKHLYVRSEYALVKLMLSEILFLETMDDYIRIHLKGQKPVLTLMSMTKMLEQLPTQHFMRVHRSYTVALSQIEFVKGKKIQMGDHTIPIGATYQSAFMETYHPDNG